LAPLLVIELVIVLYLLPQSGGVSLTCTCSPIRVPRASNGAELEAGPVLSVRANELVLDGRPIITVAELTAQLVTLRNNWHLLHPVDSFSPFYVLDAAPEVTSGRIVAAQRAAAAAGFTRPQYLVEIPYSNL
jgi:hypothetical protein